MNRYLPFFRYDHQIVSNISIASTFEERLKGRSISISDRQNLSALANIDAVHFSTKLEGNNLTYKQVTEILTDTRKDWEQERNLLEILNYSKVRAWLFKQAKSNHFLGDDIVLKAHKMLLSNIVEGRLKGHYRDSQNVIKDSKSGGIVYLPPEIHDVKPLMKGLLNWVKKSEVEGISPYIIASIFHYRFVTIHPFLDGNGRLARLLTSYILISNNIVLPEYASLEKHHEQNRSSYYSELNKLQGLNFYDIPAKLDVSSWIVYWLDGLIETYKEADTRFREKVADHPIEYNEIIDREPRLAQALTLFKKHKSLKAKDYEILMGLGRTQAVADLNQLVAEGFITRTGGGRSSAYTLK